MNHVKEDRRAVFLVRCPDQKGLVTKITGFFFARGLNIVTCRQHIEKQRNLYFMRLVVDLTELDNTRKHLEQEFNDFASQLQLVWQVHYHEPRSRMAIMVSKTSHCLYDLLTHAQEGELDCEIPLIISNHPDLEHVADQFRIPFYCLPITPETKPQQEKEVLELLRRHRIDLVVLARYMQVLSDDFIGNYPERIINIHHAFLPAFQGGNPYLRAWERGVKMIGATAHYATAELDEGPIIEQDVERISHEDTPEKMKQLGKDIERRVLTRAVKAHLEHRILTEGCRTIVFAG